MQINYLKITLRFYCALRIGIKREIDITCSMGGTAALSSSELRRVDGAEMSEGLWLSVWSVSSF